MDNSLSIFSLIISAGAVVQIVMLVLVLMSIYSWTIIMSKKKILMDASKDIKVFNQQFSKHTDLGLLHKKLPNNSSMARIFDAGYGEFTHTNSNSEQALVVNSEQALVVNSEQALVVNSERAYRSMNTVVNHEVDKLDQSLSVLAMIASSSPYIGLFGTVWGIMHSFIGLASVKQATISIVAPGIAEALIATAFGLFAAIPATIAYNRLVTQVSEINNKYNAFTETLFVNFQRQK